MTLESAIEVFVRAFSAGKSRTYPYLAERVDGFWIMQDAPGRKDPRKIEVVSCGLGPERTVEVIANAGIGWHFVCEVHDAETDFDAVRLAYKNLGYRAISTEWLFIHDLRAIPIHVSDPAVRLVESQAEADTIPLRASHKMKLAEGSRQFAIWDDARDYGRVRSVPYGTAAWVADLHVQADVRGRGYGRALMSALLQSDRSHGVTTSVLLASSAGARLYPHLGYRQIGILQMFCPAERK